MSQSTTSPSDIQDEPASVEIPEITPAMLRRMLAEDRPVQVIDIRSREEFDEWRIPTSLSWPAPETPPNHETVTAYNRRGRLPERKELIELEAGANRCAVG